MDNSHQRYRKTDKLLIRVQKIHLCMQQSIDESLNASENHLQFDIFLRPGDWILNVPISQLIGGS